MVPPLAGLCSLWGTWWVQVCRKDTQTREPSPADPLILRPTRAAQLTVNNKKTVMDTMMVMDVLQALTQ